MTTDEVSEDPSTGRKYSNPPIVEAVCEFRLSQESKWDLTIPGLVYKLIGGDFPKKQKRIEQNLTFAATKEGIQQGIQTRESAVFLSDDEKTLVRIGHHVLAVSRVKPYSSWEEYRPSIETAFQALVSSLEVEGLERIGLRYRNQIEVPVSSMNLEDYFEFTPNLGEKLPQNLANFIVGAEFQFEEGRDWCRVSLTNLRSGETEVSSFFLDIDYFLAEPEAITPKQAISWVETAHSRIEGIFEACITDKLRELFGEMEQ